MRCDRIWFDARLMTLAAGTQGLGVVEDGIVAAKDGRIVYAGPAADAPPGWTPRTASVSTAAGSAPD